MKYSLLVVRGGVMLIVARENPYPLALSDSPEVYTGLKGELARQPELANIKLTTWDSKGPFT